MGGEQRHAGLSFLLHNSYVFNNFVLGRFVNDLAELQRFQLAITQIESSGPQDQLNQARQSMCDMQRRASQLYEQLTDRRVNLVRNRKIYRIFEHFT